MTTAIKPTIKVEIAGAGTMSASVPTKVEAYDKVEVTVPPASGDTAGSRVVDVQPGGHGQVQLLFITAEPYSKESARVTYSVESGQGNVELDAPQLFLGTGAVGLLGTEQKSITFSNKGSEEVAIRILAGRDATPEPIP